jgi:hypothetical protein
MCTRSRGMSDPRRSTAATLEAPPDRRSPQHPAHGHVDRREPPRRHPAAAAARRGTADPRTAWPASTQALRAVRRPRLRRRQVPTSAPRPRHQPAHRPPRSRAPLRAEQGPCEVTGPHDTVRASRKPRSSIANDG